MEPGFTLHDRTRRAVVSRTRKNARPVWVRQSQVEKDLEKTETYLTGIGLLLEKYNLKDYQSRFTKLREQLDRLRRFHSQGSVAQAAYRFPHAAGSFTSSQREELRARLHSGGTGAASRIKASRRCRRDMQKLATKIAQERHLPSSDYRDVIRALKKDQLAGDQILPHYQQTLAEIEDDPAPRASDHACRTAPRIIRLPPRPRPRSSPLRTCARLRCSTITASAASSCCPWAPSARGQGAQVRRFHLRRRVLDADRA